MGTRVLLQVLLIKINFIFDLDRHLFFGVRAVVKHKAAFELNQWKKMKVCVSQGVLSHGMNGHRNVMPASSAAVLLDNPWGRGTRALP